MKERVFNSIGVQMSIAHLRTESEKLKQEFENLQIDQNEIIEQRNELEMMAQILEESKCKISLMEKISKNTLIKVHEWAGTQQSNFVAPYFKKNLSLSRSILTKDTQDDSQINIPMGDKSMKKEITSPVSQDINKENENSLSIVEFPIKEMSAIKHTSSCSNNEQIQSNEKPTEPIEEKKIEVVDEEEPDYDSPLFVPDPDFLNKINKNMQSNDCKVIGTNEEQNMEPQEESEEIEEVEEIQENKVEKQESSVEPHEKKESAGGLSFPSFADKEANESDDEKDITVNGKLFDQQKKAKYGIKSYAKNS